MKPKTHAPLSSVVKSFINANHVLKKNRIPDVV